MIAVMKNKVLLIAFLFSIISCSSEQPTIQNLVEKDFMNYVQDNFDNPKDLKEIVSINIEDTVSYESLKGIAKDCIKMIEATDSIDKELQDDYSEKMKFMSRIDMSSFEKEKYTKMRLECLRYVEEEYLECSKSENILKSIVEKKDGCCDSLYYVFYEIKVRTLVNNKLKLQKYYASVQNNNIIKIYSEPITMKDLPSGFQYITDAIEDSRAIYKKRVEFWEKVQKIINFVVMKNS